MTQISDALDALKDHVAGREMALFLDYDGTLAPIAQRPEKAVLACAMRSLLQDLAAAPACRVCVVSGRALADIKELIGVGNIGYVGNHGFEMDVPDFVLGNFDLARTGEVLGLLKEEIGKAISFFEGAFVEDKGITLSVHYRLVRPRSEGPIKRLLEDITKPFVARGEVRVSLGKKVFEIKPLIDWDKGRAVVWLLGEHQKACGTVPAVVYIGDDRTDEDAFEALTGRGITIKVGEGATAAEYHVKDQNEVIVLLKAILDLRGKG
ncbi:MAG: trehalose-phosphatase [Candidatus Omnitrophica bacterium]|nr:trehalose-phosphatase [Candidatus Omnitrophota bacterium]